MNLQGYFFSPFERRSGSEPLLRDPDIANEDRRQRQAKAGHAEQCDLIEQIAFQTRAYNSLHV
jgi:hypothetical protein